MALQTSYALDPSVSYEGQIVENRVSRPATNRTGAAMPLGRFVQIDATNSAASEIDIKVLATGATAASICGVLTHSHAGPTSGASGPGFLEDKKPGNILKDGVVWVLTEQAVTPADPVFVRIIDGGAGLAVGQVRKDADTANAVACDYARFESVAGAAALVKVSIKLP